jgi:hypothetical protein
MLPLSSVLEVPRHRPDRLRPHPVWVRTVLLLLLLYTRVRRHASWTRFTDKSWSIERAMYRACFFMERRTELRKSKRRRDGPLLVVVPSKLGGRVDQTLMSTHITHLVRLRERAWKWVNENEKCWISCLGPSLGHPMGYCLIDAPSQLCFQAKYAMVWPPKWRASDAKI